MKKKIICFDLDDTIIDSNYKFQLTFSDCIKEILLSFETDSPMIDDVMVKARELDDLKIKTYPPRIRFLPKRLEDTWFETYTDLCRERGVKPKKYVYGILKGVIDKNFDQPWYVIPGVNEILKELDELNGVDLHVVTIGDEKTQLAKLKSTKLLRYFEHVKVCKVSKREYLAKLAKENGRENVIMVGNSLKSDIRAAVMAKVQPIYIPRASWHHYFAKVDEREYITISEIAELPKIIRKLWGGK